MIKLYACLGSGNCFKPFLAMRQLGISFDMTLINVLTGEQKTPAYLNINPLGVVPYLETEAGQGIGESNAMLWYLAEGTYLMPRDRAERAEALQWMFFEQSKLEPYISPARFFTTILPDQREARADSIANWRSLAEPGLFRLDAHLSDRQFMLESGYSIADIAVFGYVHVLEEAGLSMEDFPAIERWIGDVSRTDGFRPLAELGSAQSKIA
ncbi:glutathione S-transferase family protein [Roseovarius sp. CAU 1744]|uniref:glutathione S-transferase family protein n=1 Tax=Roseovarius sp. CAU 1744 TaxID=3140368 RepID=UPI00325C0C3A